MGKLATVAFPQPDLAPDEVNFIRYGALGDGIIATTESGSWHHFTKEEFDTYLAGTIPVDTPLSDALTRKGFLRSGYDLEFHSRKFRTLKRFLGAGIAQHFVCLNGSEGDLETDKAKAIADQVVTSASDSLHITFVDGGAGLATGIVDFFMKYAKEKNQYEGKALSYSFRSGLQNFSAEDAAWLIQHKIALETHLEGSEEFHNQVADANNTASFVDVVAGIELYLEAGKSAQKERHQIFLTATTTLRSGCPASEVVSRFQDIGIREFRLLPPEPGDDLAAFSVAYSDLLNTMMNLESGTPRIRELVTSALLQRIQLGLETEDGSLYTPAASGLAVLSYDTQGRIFPDEQARLLFAEGDEMFHLGNAGEVDPKEVRKSPTVRALTIASIADCLPGYQHLWSVPFLGLDPVFSYRESGDLFPCLPRDTRAQARHAMVEALFTLLLTQGEDDDGVFMQLSGTGNDGI